MGKGLAIHFEVPALRRPLQRQTDSEVPASGSGEHALQGPTIVMCAPFLHLGETLQKGVAVAFCTTPGTLSFEMNFHRVPVNPLREKGWFPDACSG